ncbi:ribose-phosphate pyrophosphokinase [Pediococcus argentinicus]|uniref:Putative ribose-phosphate pyrophosphokinase n=2 Tax=Pediococcus argentinicus TaxID=480391 RepID=A0A0R2NIE7_9LACO|nr:ribose-phosphate pyrophosphokinase [Pediococcus argentinicus]GEP20098.1 ribose-phosphate pyrophosphokinase 2 [Pediococcus argentinicus]
MGQIEPKMKLFALNANVDLAEKIAKEVGLSLGKASVKQFSDGEIQVNIDESIRGSEVYVIQSISDPINDSLMELLIMVDALRRASASQINVVIPYYGYSRQDRKARSREPITAKLIANLLEDDQVTRVLTLDLHAPQIQGFFDVPVDHLAASPLLASYFTDHNFDPENMVVVSPDHASVSRARTLAEKLGTPIAIIDNRNVESSESLNEIPTEIIGGVKGKVAIVIDDMIDTGTRITISAQALKNAGAVKVYGAATHAIFSRKAPEILQNSLLEKVIVTDSIRIGEEKKFDKLVELSVGPLIGNAIEMIHNNEPLAPLFRSQSK